MDDAKLKKLEYLFTKETIDFLRNTNPENLLVTLEGLAEYHDDLTIEESLKWRENKFILAGDYDSGFSSNLMHHTIFINEDYSYALYKNYYDYSPGNRETKRKSSKIEGAELPKVIASSLRSIAGREHYSFKDCYPDTPSSRAILDIPKDYYKLNFSKNQLDIRITGYPTLKKSHFKTAIEKRFLDLHLALKQWVINQFEKE